MSYSIGFHAGESKQCSMTGCKAGTLIVAGQLEFHFLQSNTPTSRHLDCLGVQLRQSIRSRHKTADDLPGYKKLKPGDKERVRKSIGWSEDVPAASGSQNNNARQGGKNEPKTNSKAKAPETKAPGNAAGISNSTRQAGTRPISPAQSESWYSNAASWNDPEPPRPTQMNARANRGKENDDTNKQEGRRNVQPERNVEPVPPSAGSSYQPIWPWPSQRRDNDDSRNAPPSISNDNNQDFDYPIASSGPPPAAQVEVDTAVLMRLELEDKEAEARLAEAELLLAETRVKVETARRAVIAQKLMMAKAGVSPTL